MTDPADRIAQLQQIKVRVLAEHGRTWLYADEHPEALQEVVASSIELSTHQSPSHVWSMPAGCVRIVNALHRDFLKLHAA